MTLLLNEIHISPGFSHTFQIAAADRRISRSGKFDSKRKKLFSIPYLKATISYFSMASFFIGTREIFLSDWLPKFITKQRGISYDIEAFCLNLQVELNSIINPQQLSRIGSGFHIACYHNNDLPDFYYISNIKTIDNFVYKDFLPKYEDPRSDFLMRDARKLFGWDGSDPSSVTQEGIWVYRNGDFKEHAVASASIDTFMGDLFELGLGGYARPTSIDAYAEYARFRFKLLSFIHLQWSKTRTISPPIDILILTKDGVREFKSPD